MYRFMRLYCSVFSEYISVCVWGRNYKFEENKKGKNSIK